MKYNLIGFSLILYIILNKDDLIVDVTVPVNTPLCAM